LAGVEDKFRILLGNFLSYERELLMIGTERMVDGRFDHEVAWHHRLQITRRVVNYLTAVRLYTDQVAHEIKASRGAPAHEAWKKKTHEVYDSKPGYRIVCALRNVVQHSALPVHVVGYPFGWRDDDGRKSL